MGDAVTGISRADSASGKLNSAYAAPTSCGLQQQHGVGDPPKGGCVGPRATSSLVNTLGMRRLWAGRLMSLSHGRSMPNTSAVEKQDGAQSLVMGGCRNFALGGQHRKKCFYTRRSNVARVLHRATSAGPANEKTYPIQVNLFRAEAIVQVTTVRLNGPCQAGDRALARVAS